MLISPFLHSTVIKLCNLDEMSVFELDVRLKLTSSSRFRNDTKVSYYGNAKGEQNLFSKYGLEAFILGLICFSWSSISLHWYSTVLFRLHIENV